MTSLKLLTLIALPKTEGNPTLERRQWTVTRLEEQKLLLSNPRHVRKVRMFTKVDGIRTSVENDQRVNPWWKQNTDGSYVFMIKSGSEANRN